MEKSAIKGFIPRTVEQEIEQWLAGEPRTKDEWDYEKCLFERTHLNRTTNTGS